MRTYVAASSSELARSRYVAGELADLGVEVVSSWADTVEAVGEGNPRGVSADKRAGWATACLTEVASADAVLLLVPAGHSHGAFLELGFALGLGDKILVAAGDVECSVFCALVEEFDDDDDAIKWLASFEPSQVAAYRRGWRPKSGHVPRCACSRIMENSDASLSQAMGDCPLHQHEARP